MDKPIIAVIQHKLLVTKTLEELQDYFHRFLRLAKTKGAHMAVFPEYSGLAVAVPMLPGWRNALLKEAAAPRRGILPRLKRALAGSAANVVRADLKKSLLMVLSEMPESLYQVYADFFGGLARDYDMTLVAGSLYVYDVQAGALRHRAHIFGPDGSLLGRQDHILFDAHTLSVVEAGSAWVPISTPVGRVGLLFGPEVLLPEPARALAYQAADMLITLAATQRPAMYHKIHQAALARAQENQLYGAISFLVGDDPLAGAEAGHFLGRSAIFAPLEFTPRFTGVMTALGSSQAEGVVTAEWDYPALRALWDGPDGLRRQMPFAQLDTLIQAYAQGLTLDAAASRLALPEAESQAPALPPPESFDETEAVMADLPAPAPSTEAPSIEEVTPAQEEEELALFAPILPTEPPVIPLPSPDEETTDDDNQEEEAPD